MSVGPISASAARAEKEALLATLGGPRPLRGQGLRPFAGP